MPIDTGVYKYYIVPACIQYTVHVHACVVNKKQNKQKQHLSQ